MKKRMLPLLVPTLLLLAAVLAGCNKDETDGDQLPDGKYPLTLAATGNTWAGSEKVAVQMGDEVKQYTAAVDGTLTVASGGTTFYWANRTTNVSAWHAATYSATKPTFRVTIPAVDGITVIRTGLAELTDGTYYEIKDNATTFSVSYTVSDYKVAKSFPVAHGLCDVKRTLASDGTHTFTYSNIRSDLKLAYDFYCEPGDFYCKNASGNDYLIPGDIATPTDDQKDACLGIIFWLGDITSANYGLLDGKLTSGTHGLVACKQLLTDPDNEQSQKMTWTYSEDSYVNDWLNTAIWSGGIPRPNSFTSIQDQNEMQGYANTVALQEYNTAKGGTSNLRVKPICALANFVEDNPAPINSSGWYWPSVNELKMMCWGQGHTTQGLDGRNMLNRQFEKVNGQLLEEVPSWIYWSSTENQLLLQRSVGRTL